LNRKATKIRVEYDDGSVVEITPDHLVNTTDDEDTASHLWKHFTGGLRIVREMLGLPYKYSLTDALRTLRDEGPEALEKDLDAYEP
jgi:hypothetical protein